MVKFPSWFKNHREEVEMRMASWNPYPFDQPADDSGFLSCHHNDYLRLSAHPEVISEKNKATNATGSGRMASLSYGGDYGHHSDFRKRVAEVTGAEDVLLTTCGWTANVGVVESIVAPGMPIYIDLNAHASLWDGARLSSGKVIPVRHNSPDSMRLYMKKYGPGVILIDGFYSTHGSVAPLEEYVKLSEEFDSLLVLDEAHSFGMIGKNGGGLAVELGLQDRIPIRTVSLAKALGGNGGFIATDKNTVSWLMCRDRSVIFSSSPPPSVSAGNDTALKIISQNPDIASHTLKMAEYFRKLLNEYGIDTGPSKCQIVSLNFDNELSGCQLYGELRKNDILFSVFLFPAVPKGTSLARFSIYSELTKTDIEYIAEHTHVAMKKLGIESKYPKK